MKYTRSEKRDFIYAGFMISLAFAFLFSGGYRSFLSPNILLVKAFVIAFFTAGVAFLLHELMHKYVAQSYGLKAEFRAFPSMLWLALLFSLFGFIIAAPGAVFIGGGAITREKNGKISIAGPITNVILAILFGILLLIFGSSGTIGSIFKYGLGINALLAAFNMIPVLPFDGAKVLSWNKKYYYFTLLIAVALFILSWLI